MALSNWDLLAFNTQAEPCNGVITTPSGAMAEIRKNWISIHDEKMWKKGTGFCHPVIAQVHEGDVGIAGFDIRASRCSQEGIMCYIASTTRVDGKVTKSRMAGIGCYGYHTPYNKILAQHSKSLEDYPDDTTIFEGSTNDANGTREYIDLVWSSGSEKFEYEPTEELKTRYVGVTDSTFKEFLAWLEKILGGEYNSDNDKEWLEKIKFAEPLRLNQGDMFIADVRGLPYSGTEPGKQEEPLITQALSRERKR